MTDPEHFRKHEEMYGIFGESVDGRYHAHEQQALDPLRNIPEKFRRRRA